MIHQLKNSILVFLSLFIVILLSEFTLRFFYEPIESGWGWNNSPRRNLAEYRNDNPNQLGLRGQRISYNKDDFVVLLVGDSQVEAATSKPEEMPERFLEKYLNEKMAKNVKVFSIAASGWGQDQQLLALKEYYLSYRANLVLIWSTPKNDYWENAFPDRSVTKVAGHLKPTYFLEGNNLKGPFLRPNNYYKNSVLIQLFYSAIQNYKNETLEQLILDEWIEKLPDPHSAESFKVDLISENYVNVDLKGFSRELPFYSNLDSIIISLNEDYLSSRSHFSPYGKIESPRDKYLIKITQKLFAQISQLCASQNSTFIVFYPIREKYDLAYSKTIKFIKNPSIPNILFPVNLDYHAKLKIVVGNESLIIWNLKSDQELCISSMDRHLNTNGNDLIMKDLSNLMVEKTKF